jgi:type II secretion system protein N
MKPLDVLRSLDTPVVKRRLAYGAFALVAFALSLRWTFPSEAVRERLIFEAGARGWEIEMGDVGPGGVVGVRARDVRLQDRTGIKIPVDEVTASLRVLSLLAGKQVLAFDGRLYDGRITGVAQLSGDVRHLAMDVAGVDLARALPLKKATGMDLQGKLGGKVDLALPAAPDGKPTGRIDLDVAGAGITGGLVPVPGMTGGLPLPQVALGAVAAAVKLDQGKASVEKLEVRGGDAELVAEGLSVVLQPKLEFAPIMGKAKLRIQPAFWAKSGTSGFKGIAEMALAPSRGSDGAYQFSVFGSLGHPQFRPAGAGGQ